MTDDSSDPFDPSNAFRRVTLTDDQAAYFRQLSARRRSLYPLVSEVILYTLFLKGESVSIDTASRAGLRHHIDETKLLIAALAARDEDELRAKLAALDEREPLVEANVNLRAMLEAGARSDILRLKPRNPPRWMLDWSLS
jgi:hypothetical protein